MMSGIILLSCKGKAPGLLRLRLATASLLAMTGEKTFYETINDRYLKDLSIVNPQERDISALAVCHLFLHFYGQRGQRNFP